MLIIVILIRMFLFAFVSKKCFLDILINQIVFIADKTTQNSKMKDSFLLSVVLVCTIVLFVGVQDTEAKSEYPFKLYNLRLFHLLVLFSKEILNF